MRLASYYSVILTSTSGVPVVIVSFLVGLNNRGDFITERACWCRGSGAIFWMFVGTISLILLVRIIFKCRQRTANHSRTNFDDCV